MGVTSLFHIFFLLNHIHQKVLSSAIDAPNQGLSYPRERCSSPAPQQPNGLHLPLERGSTDPRRASEPGVRAAAPPALRPLSIGTCEDRCPTPLDTK